MRKIIHIGAEDKEVTIATPNGTIRINQSTADYMAVEIRSRINSTLAIEKFGPRRTFIGVRNK